MGQAYNESYIEFRSKRKINYCNKLFSSWDFNITEETSAKLKSAQIRREFEVSRKWLLEKIPCVPGMEILPLLILAGFLSGICITLSQPL